MLFLLYYFVIHFFNSYDLSDGQYRQEETKILNRGTDDEQIVVTGRYSYVGTDGRLYEVTYVADKNGFHIVRPIAVDAPSEILTPDAPVSIDPNLIKSLFG